MNQYTKLAIGIGVLLLLAGGFILYESYPLINGETVVLATRPVDPFDPLRGQYIVINYDVNSITVPEGSQAGATVYVKLEPDDGGVWRYAGSSLERPEGIFLAGTIERVNGEWAQVNYGIEQYFFERNAQLEPGNLTVQVRIAPSGRPKIEQLLINGTPARFMYSNLSLTS
jgi:uncharacterized membrane-anchored protein